MLSGLDITRNLEVIEKDNFYEIKYQREILPTNNNSVQTLSKANDKSTFKIRKSDLTAAGLTIDSSELRAFIADGLKIMVGFDFDQTMSNKHTWYEGDDLTESNLKGGEFARKIYSSCYQQGNLYPFIATNNYGDKVEETLKAWKIDGFFYAIKSRNDFHSSGGDKEICFRQIYDLLKEDSALDNEGFLNLKAQGKTIDVVAGILIDDDKNVKKFERYGLRTIKVNPQPNVDTHLRDFDNCYITADKNLQKILAANQKMETTTIIPNASYAQNISLFAVAKVPEQTETVHNASEFKNVNLWK